MQSTRGVFVGTKLRFAPIKNLLLSPYGRKDSASLQFV